MIKKQPHVGDLYEDSHLKDYLLCVLTLSGELQMISTPRINYKSGILTFTNNLPRITSQQNPLEERTVLWVGHFDEDLADKTQVVGILHKKTIIIELPEEFERHYMLSNSQ